MSILLSRETNVIVQGITGRMARFHTKDMIDYGTNVVGGVVPGKGGEKVEGVPVFDTVKDAVEATGAEASLVFVPPPFAADSIMEAADAGIQYCVCITDGIPAQDMIRVKRYMMRYSRDMGIDEIASTALPGPVRRPANTTLDCTSLFWQFGIVQPNWRDALEAARASGDLPPVLADGLLDLLTLLATFGGSREALDVTLGLDNASISCNPSLIFADGFESGHTLAWSETVR